jgi:hypothetical protein
LCHTTSRGSGAGETCIPMPRTGSWHEGWDSTVIFMGTLTFYGS